MKTKEFTRQVEELGFSARCHSDRISIEKDPNTICALVDENYVGSLDTLWDDFERLEDSIKNKLFNLLAKYASTPIEERQEEYYIRHKYFTDKNGYLNYLNEANDEPEEEKWFLSDIEPEIEIDELKFSFTLEELPDWVHKMIEDGYMTKEEVE